MINGFKITLFVLVLLNSPYLYPQVKTECGESSNNTDPVLINGRIYTYFLSHGVGGDQFLKGPEFVEGSLIIRDKNYSGRLLNYDVYNQQLLLKYERANGAPEIIEISRAWLRGFRLGDRMFTYRPSSENNPGFYQVIGQGPLMIYYQWYKKLELQNVTTSANYVFSAPQKWMFLYHDNLLQSFRNNRSFLKRLDPAIMIQVRKYMRSNHIRVNKAADAQMADLVNHCNSLLP